MVGVWKRPGETDAQWLERMGTKTVTELLAATEYSWRYCPPSDPSGSTHYVETLPGETLREALDRVAAAHRAPPPRTLPKVFAWLAGV